MKHMVFAPVWLALALAGCGARPAGAPVAAQPQMYSTASLPAGRLVGTWAQIAGQAAGQGAPNCAPRPALEFAPDSTGQMQVRYDLCLGAFRSTGEGPLGSVAGLDGRYILPNLSAPLWVLWIDENNRTMALGTPDRSFGMIVSIDNPPPDRMNAAREILAWNGYDLTQFHNYAAQ